jgi:sugar phosphate isomerase/epimerase
VFRDALTLAAELEAPGMTLLPGIHWPGESREDSFARAVEELGWRVEEGRARGVRVSVEPHVGSFADTPDRALRLAQESGVELTLDYTHFVFQGIPQAEVEPLVAHARHFHARGGREGRLQTTLRDSTIDYGRVLDVMAETGYDGYVGIEYVWTPGEPPGGPYDLTNTDNVSETILLRDLLRAHAARGEGG